jgi:hypothetical protein
MTDLRTAALRALLAHDKRDLLALTFCMEDIRNALYKKTDTQNCFEEREADWALQKKHAEQTIERDRQWREAQSIIKPEIKVDKEPRLLPWKGLTEEEHTYYKACGFVGVKAVEEKLRARNSTLACIPAVPPG